MNDNADVMAEEVVHQSLERGRPVTVALLKHVAQYGPVDGGERGLPNVRRFDTDLLVSVRQIDLRPNWGSGYVHANLFLVREWCNVLDRVQIAFSAVHNGTQTDAIALR